ncbi:hypothetical protein V6Z12_A10G253200 [Gossypium hirsutum]
MFLLQFEQWCRGAMEDQTSRTLLRFRNPSLLRLRRRRWVSTTKVCMAWRSRSWAWSVVRMEAVTDGVCSAWE